MRVTAERMMSSVALTSLSFYIFMLLTTRTTEAMFELDKAEILKLRWLRPLLQYVQGS